MSEPQGLVWVQYKIEEQQTKRSVIRRQAARWSYDSGKRQPKQAKRDHAAQEFISRPVHYNGQRTRLFTTATPDRARSMELHHNSPTLMICREPFPDAPTRPGDLYLPRDLAVRFFNIFEYLLGSRGLEWITRVVESPSSRVIKQSLCTLAYGLCSEPEQSLLFREHAARQYTELLHYFHQQMSFPTAICSWESSSCMYLAFLIELLVWLDDKKSQIHLETMLSAFAVASPGQSKEDLAFLTLRGGRYFAMPLYLIKRQPCPVASPILCCTPSWIGKEEPLLDMIVEITLGFCALFSQYHTVCNTKHRQDELDRNVSYYLSDLTAWKQSAVTRLPQTLLLFESTSQIDDKALSNLSRCQADNDHSELLLSVSLYSAAWLLLARLGSLYDFHLPKPALALVEDIVCLFEAQSSQKEHSGILHWIFLLRIAIYTPGAQDIYSVRKLCLNLKAQPSFYYLFLALNGG